VRDKDLKRCTQSFCKYAFSFFKIFSELSKDLQFRMSQKFQPFSNDYRTFWLVILSAVIKFDFLLRKENRPNPRQWLHELRGLFFCFLGQVNRIICSWIFFRENFSRGDTLHQNGAWTEKEGDLYPSVRVCSTRKNVLLPGTYRKPCFCGCYILSSPHFLFRCRIYSGARVLRSKGLWVGILLRGDSGV